AGVVSSFGSRRAAGDKACASAPRPFSHLAGSGRGSFNLACGNVNGSLEQFAAQTGMGFQLLMFPNSEHGFGGMVLSACLVGAEGLSEKTHIERENKWLLSNGLPTSHMQLRDIRQTWELCANRHLEKAGLDVRIDHRSHSERGLEIEPTEHMGVHATQMQRRGGDVSRGRLDKEAAERNAELIRQKPEQVLAVISREKSVFDRHDIARTLHRYIDGDPQTFQNAFSSVMASDALVELKPEGEGRLACYST